MSTAMLEALRIVTKAVADTKEHKDFAFEIKEIDDGGKFTGLASTYGNRDAGGDVVQKGAFDKTIAERGDEVVILWQHDAKMPIGLGKLEDSDKGLLIHGVLDLELSDAKDAYRRLKSKLVKGLSIGFRTMKEDVKDGVRFLKEIKLYEVSLVTFPMNESAIVTAVKAGENGEVKMDFATAFDEIELWNMPWSMTSAISESLFSIRHDDAIDTAQKLEQSLEALEQFREKYMEFLPRFLELMDKMKSLKAFIEQEQKAGRRISSATQTQLSTVLTKLEEATETLRALLGEEAAEDDSTSKQGAVRPKATEPEAQRIHSFVATLPDKVAEAFSKC